MLRARDYNVPVRDYVPVHSAVIEPRLDAADISFVLCSSLAFFAFFASCDLLALPLCFLHYLLLGLPCFLLYLSSSISLVSCLASSLALVLLFALFLRFTRRLALIFFLIPAFTRACSYFLPAPVRSLVFISVLVLLFSLFSCV